MLVNPVGAVVAVVLLLLVAACGIANAPVGSTVALSTTSTVVSSSTTTTEAPATTLVVTTTFQSVVATTSSTIPPRAVEPPSLFAGSVTGGTPLVVVEQVDKVWLETFRFDDLPGQITDVVVTHVGVVASTCCEPASGVRSILFDGAIDEPGYGPTTDFTSGVTVTIDVNAMAVTLSDATRNSTLESQEEWPAVAAAFDLDGGLVTVSLTDTDQLLALRRVDSPWEQSFFDAVPAIYMAGGDVAALDVDREGMIWLSTAQNGVSTTVTVDPITGSATELDLGAVADLAFDDSGTYLLTAYMDGRVTIREYDSDVGIAIVGIPPLDRVAW